MDVRLRSERLTLRPVSEADIPTIVAGLHVQTTLTRTDDEAARLQLRSRSWT